MSKKIFSEKEMKILSNNPYVKSGSKRVYLEPPYFNGERVQIGL
jgi:RNA-binding protein YlmH